MTTGINDAQTCQGGQAEGAFLLIVQSLDLRVLLSIGFEF